LIDEKQKKLLNLVGYKLKQFKIATEEETKENE